MEVETSKLKEYELNKVHFPNGLPSGDHDALKQDIAKNGIKTELHILPNNIVLCGHNRLKVARELNLKTVPVKVITNLKTPEEIEEYVIIDNLLRRHLSPEQKIPLFDRLDRIVSSQQGLRTDLTSPQSAEKLDSRGIRYKIMAEKTGENARTIERYVLAAKILRSRPELKGKKISQVLFQEKKEKQLEAIKKLVPVAGEYNVVVIDPPWDMNGAAYNAEGFRGGAKYPAMTLDKIKDIKLPLAKDAIVWLWAIDTMLEESLEVIKTWGLERKGTIVWCKDKIGLGKWLRQEHEYCFLCVKGKPVFKGENARSVLYAERGQHSAKPDSFYSFVESTCQYEKKLDYFVRKKRSGWDAYGDEVK